MSYSANTDDDATALRELFRRILYGVHTSMPGIITAVGDYRGAKVVTVQPAIQQIDTLDDVAELKPIPPIPNVPICIPYAQGLGLSITIPIRVGDEGMIHFSERSIDNWFERGGVQAPAEPVQPRAHDLADAVFVPGIVPVPYAVTGWSEDAVEVRNADASVALSITQSAVEMRAASESIRLPGDGNIYITGNIIHTGDQITSGGVVAQTVAAQSSMSVAGQEAKDHDHGPGSYIDSDGGGITGRSGALT